MAAIGVAPAAVAAKAAAATSKKTLGPKKKEVPTWPIQCKKCHEYVHDLETFYKHMVDHWSQDNICPMCGKEKAVKKEHDKVRTSRNNFRTHLMLHTGEMPFTCKTCGSGFRQKSHMENHIKKNHSDGRVDPEPTHQVKKRSTKGKPNDAASYAHQQQQLLQQQQVQHQLLQQQQQPANYALPKAEDQHHPAVIVQYQDQQPSSAVAAAAGHPPQAAAAVPQDVRSLVTNVLAQQEMETAASSQLSQATQQLIPAAAQPQLLPHDVRSLLLQQIGANGAAGYHPAHQPTAAAAAAAAIQPAFLNNEFIGYFNPQAAAVQRVIVQQEQQQQPSASDFSAIANHRPT